MRGKKLLLSIAAIMIMVSFMLPGSEVSSQLFSGTAPASQQSSVFSAAEASTAVARADRIPKYIFLFIGDGMSFPQVTALGHFNGTIKGNFVGTLAEPTPENIPQAHMPSFVDFPAVGAATTYDASKFITDSASAATAIACSVKTLDGAIGVDPYNNSVPSIAEKLKKEAGYKIGIISSVSFNHATPAGFYAHVPNRNSFYAIGLDLIASNFDFFGGCGFMQPTGKEKDKEHIVELARKAGYKVVNTYEEIKALDSSVGKTIAINPVFDSPKDAAINFDIDRDESDYSLSDYVQKAIDVLGEDNTFFIMAEGGKIDWACHANDAYTAIKEVKDLEKAVNVAVDFARRHPDETLILVTGDHETGGFSMGFNGTQYDTYLALLQNQKLSFSKFTSDYVQKYRNNNTSFEADMLDVKELYGLVMPNDPDVTAMEDKSLVLTKKEADQLREAYAISMIPYSDRNRDKEYKTTYSMYNHEPFQIVITRLLNNRAGLAWTSTAHSGLPVAVYAMGAGQELFGNFYDNTDISKKILSLVGIVN